jgi:hypothetical protein
MTSRPEANDLSAFLDKEMSGQWRVEYFDDGSCFVNIFAGPHAA